jgi:hypothetical protein
MHRHANHQSFVVSKLKPVNEFLTECWAKDMSVSTTFSLARTKGYSITYKQITDHFNSKSSAFNTSFNAIFQS